jgi:hypothetical protein
VDRRLFYVPLDAGNYGQLKDVQGLTAMRDDKVYDPAVGTADRGVGKLMLEPQRTHWDRIVRDVGTSVLASAKTEPVTLAVVAMNTAMAAELDQILTRKLIGPTLQELLDAYGLAFTDVKQRYHDTAFAWQPFGTERTVLDLMEAMRVEANARMKEQPEYWFRWDPWDLLETVRGVKSYQELRDSMQRLAKGPFALVVDPKCSRTSAPTPSASSRSSSRSRLRCSPRSTRCTSI